MLKKFLLIFLGAVIWGCGPSAEVVTKGGPTVAEVKATSPFEKVRIAVARFENKTPYYVGEGITDMLATALFQTGKFIVLERENLDVVLQEQKLSSIGVIDRRTGAPVGKLEGAQFLIVGAITEFEPRYRGAAAVVGEVSQSYIAMEIRIVDTTTARVVSSVRVEGKATDAILDTTALQWAGVVPMASSLKAWHHTPMEKAIRLCIERAVDFIVNYSFGR